MVLKETPDGFLLWVKATPKAAKNEMLSYQVGDSALRMKVTAAPEDGKANEAIIALLAKKLAIAKSSIQLIQGEKSRQKLFLVQRATSLTCDDILLKLTGLELTGQ